ncbi:MAG: chemotaxis protein CheW [Syntrophales bacterium]
MERTDLSAACWKETGVFGDKSCPELAGLGHCRHCPVYTAAGRRLLDRESPRDYPEEWAKLLAAPKQEGEADTLSVIVFRLGSELLALKTVFFQEAAEAAPPHSIPLRTGEVFTGIVNVNGELICCMSLAALMEIPGGDEGAAGRIAYPRLVVVARQGHRFAFAADEVLGVRRFPPEALQELPATAAKSVRALTAGIFPGEDRTIGLIAEEKLFAALTRSLAP